MDNQQVPMFKEWFLDTYPECKDYLDLTYFDVEKNTFLSKCSYNPDSGNAAKVLRIAFGSWQHQQAKVDELQVQLKGAEERAQLTLKYKDKYRLERDELQKSANEMYASIEKAQSCLPYFLLDEKSDEKWIGGVQNKIADLEDQAEELQKRVDQQGLIIAKAMSIASDLQKNWSMFEIGKKLEQALKGEG